MTQNPTHPDLRPSNMVETTNLIVAKKWFGAAKQDYPWCVALNDAASREYHAQWWKKEHNRANACTCKLVGRGRLWMFKTREERAQFINAVAHRYVEETFYAA